MKQIVIIPESAAGERLDVVLARELGTARNQIAKLFKQGLITIEGQAVGAKLSAKPGMSVEVEQPTVEEQPPAPELKVLYEDDDILAVDKPAGLAVHLSESGRPQPTVAAFAAEQGVEDDDLERPGIVHRLDKETSGVLLVAKHPAAKAYLQQLFRERQVEKTYLALVRGRISPAEASINLPIDRSRKQPTKRAVVPGGRPAVTHYRVIEELPGASLLEIKLETGRTHQIRVHFAHLGHPVVGDDLYGGPNLGGSQRQFLHAVRLQLKTQGNKNLTIESPMPEDLVGVLNRLREAV
jgi:23S rRNA pseudouridine1911/1915/1917 synthase